MRVSNVTIGDQTRYLVINIIHTWKYLIVAAQIHYTLVALTLPLPNFHFCENYLPLPISHLCEFHMCTCINCNGNISLHEWLKIANQNDQWHGRNVFLHVLICAMYCAQWLLKGSSLKKKSVSGGSFIRGKSVKEELNANNLPYVQHIQNGHCEFLGVDLLMFMVAKWHFPT